MPVYFIAEDENPNYSALRIKIGYSQDVERRARQLQTGSPYRLKLMGEIRLPESEAKRLERALHKQYSEYRVIGEWFELDPNDVIDILKRNSTFAYIATNDDAFEIIGYDKDAVPELVGAWQWGDLEYDEFCPSCGWACGLTYSENVGTDLCIECGFMVIDDSPEYDEFS